MQKGEIIIMQITDAIVRTAISEELYRDQIYSILIDEQEKIEQALQTTIDPKTLSNEIIKASIDTWNKENVLTKHSGICAYSFNGDYMSVICKCMISKETLESEIVIRYNYLICFDRNKLEYELLESRQYTIPLFNE